MRLALSGWSCERGTMNWGTPAAMHSQSFLSRHGGQLPDSGKKILKRHRRGSGEKPLRGTFPQGFQG